MSGEIVLEERMLQFSILGPIEIYGDAGEIRVTAQRQRALLALLLLHPNQVVATDFLIDRLWGECPPAGAQHTLEVYISRLRKTLKSAADEAVVLTRSGAYLLRVPSERIDIGRMILDRFERFV